MYSQPKLIMERVRDHDDVLAEPQNIANDYVVQPDIAAHGSKPVIGNLITMSEAPGSVKGPVPELGANTGEVMRKLGFSDAEIARAARDVAVEREELQAAVAEADGG